MKYFDSDYGNYNIRLASAHMPDMPNGAGRANLQPYPNLMKEKSKAVLWVCFTLLIASGIKYLPSYLLQQRQLDLQERTLDMKEDAFLHQKLPPTVSVPAEAVRENRSQLL